MDENSKVLKGYFNNTQLQVVNDIKDFPENRKKRLMPYIEFPRKKQRVEENNKRKAEFYIEIPVKKIKTN